MSCPSRRCSPGCGCHDFSSRAAQLPSLVSIEVVGDLLFQAVRNTVRRAVSAAAVFLADLYRILNDLSRAGVNMDGVENSPQAARLINFWARLLTGAPAEVLLH